MQNPYSRSFEMGSAVGGNIASGISGGLESIAMNQILEQAKKSKDPNANPDAMNQILQRIKDPEKRQVATQILQKEIDKTAKEQAREFYRRNGFDPGIADQPEAVQKELIKLKADENLWKDAINQRNSNLGQNPQQTPQDINQSANVMPNPNEMPNQSQQTTQPQLEAYQGNVKPVYASSAVDPKFFRKDISKYETARLAESEKGFKRNEGYLKTVQEQADSQPFIQDSIRQAITDVQSGNVSGALATMRSKLAQTFPGVLSAEEKNFTNSMKNIALEQFASTPGFRSQGEFFILQQVLPNIGDKKKAQELNLKAILDSSLMKSKEEEIILDILNQSPNGEVPTNLREMVKERLDNEWKKLYARRYAEDPKVWDEYLNSKAGKSDPLFKDIKNVPVPKSSIDWNKYVEMINPEGKKVAVHKDQVKQKLNEKYQEIK